MFPLDLSTFTMLYQTKSHLVPRNDRVELVCNYDMEGDKLYSVKWYRNGQEFYRSVLYHTILYHTIPYCIILYLEQYSTVKSQVHTDR